MVLFVVCFVFDVCVCVILSNAMNKHLYSFGYCFLGIDSSLNILRLLMCGNNIALHKNKVLK